MPITKDTLLGKQATYTKLYENAIKQAESFRAQADVYKGAVAAINGLLRDVEAVPEVEIAPPVDEPQYDEPSQYTPGGASY